MGICGMGCSVGCGMGRVNALYVGCGVGYYRYVVFGENWWIFGDYNIKWCCVSNVNGYKYGVIWDMIAREGMCMR